MIISIFDQMPLGVTWDMVTVNVIPPMVVKIPPVKAFFRPDLLPEPKTILTDSHGCVKPGEMLLVLGRPGAGCTTLLNVLSNRRSCYASVQGHVFFGSLSQREAETYQGHICMDTGDEKVFPSLTVGQTVQFASEVKTPKWVKGKSARKDYVEDKVDHILKALNIDHVRNSKVGNEYIRGVSGGERRRVAIAELLATRAAVMCWDNSTIGLDASSALDFVKTVGKITKNNGLASIMALTQASDAMYDAFDKVLVLEKGRQIFYGRTKDAEKFMESLGFSRPQGMNMTDFLTSPITAADLANQTKVPEHGEEIMSAYNRSDLAKEMRKEYLYPLTEEAMTKTQKFIRAAIGAEDTGNFVPPGYPNVPLWAFPGAYMTRTLLILRGDWKTTLARLCVTVSASLTAGSLFYGAPQSTIGLFVRNGAIYLSLLFNSMIWISEVSNTITSRSILAKQKGFGSFHPGSYYFAQFVANIYILLIQLAMSSPIIYFLADLTRDPGHFFTYFLLIFSVALCMVTFFQAMASSSATIGGASKKTGIIIMMFIVYAGYIIPRDKMQDWLGWIVWLNPLAYGFEALMGNELKGKTYPCGSDHLYPQGQGYEGDTGRACGGIGGAKPDQTFVTGDDYLSSLGLNADHIWRNLGIVYIWWLFYLFLAIWSAKRWATLDKTVPSDTEPDEKAKNKKLYEAIMNEIAAEEERALAGDDAPPAKDKEDTGPRLPQALRFHDRLVFSWIGLTYTIDTPDGARTLLQEVNGWVQPGQLLAVMGGSGSGKSTLLDVLAQRKRKGALTGSILIDGHSAHSSSRRTIGYCQQSDILEPLITVREALEFSANLRQPYSVGAQTKLDHVESLLDLLELRDIENSLIGEVGVGLARVQRKKVSIAIELAANPETVILLDEPTSGLDSQAALTLVTLLRKLADTGYAVLVTIHQPSAQTFSLFDTLLLLSSGKTTYFGAIGQGASIVRNYFVSQGGLFQSSLNPAECIISNIQGREGNVTKEQWPTLWPSSPHFSSVNNALDQMVRDGAMSHFHHRRALPAARREAYATPLWYQVKMVTARYWQMLRRDPERYRGMIMLHLLSGLFNGFSFLKIGHSITDLQLRLFTLFLFLLITPAILNQEQAIFIRLRDLYEQRERGVKTHSAAAFVAGHIVSVVPLRIVSAIVYFIAWYFSVGFDPAPGTAGRTLGVMIIMQFVSTGLAQLIAVNAPTARFANVINPAVLGAMVCFCGALVPYVQLPAVWRDSVYWIDPFNYLIGSLLVFNTFSVNIKCDHRDFAIFNPLPTNVTGTNETSTNQTCFQYLDSFLSNPLGERTSLANPNATSACELCPFTKGKDYLGPLNLKTYQRGETDAGALVAFAFGLAALVFASMWWRTRVANQTPKKKKGWQLSSLKGVSLPEISLKGISFRGRNGRGDKPYMAAGEGSPSMEYLPINMPRARITS